MLVGKLYEDVFEARSQRADFRDGNAFLQQLFAEVVQIEMVFDQRVDGLPENCGAADSGNLPGKAQRARDFRRGDFNANGPRRLNVGKFAQRM